MSKPDRSRNHFWLAMGAPMLFFLAIPCIALVVTGGLPSALRELQGEGAREAVALSIKTTLASALAIGVFATPLAYWIAMGHGWLNRAIEVASELPAALPPAAAGVALLVAFGRNGFINLGVSFTVWAVIIAQVFVATPFYMRAAVGAFSQLPEEAFDAAHADGAGQVATFSQIALPMCHRSLMGGLVVAWARAAGEFGATIIFAGNYPGRTQTMPLAIYLGFEVNLRQALALSVVLMTVAVVGFGVAQWLGREP